MSFDWKAFLADLPHAAGASFEGSAVRDFGNPDEEAVTAAEGTVVVPLGHLGLIACSGDDAAGFLHNQLTSDVAHLAAGRAQHSAWCSAKGRMLATFLVLRTAEGFLLQIADDLQAATRKRLQMFVLRAKVKLADAGDEYVQFGVSGPAAEAALAAAGLAAPAAALDVLAGDHGLVVRLDGKRFALLVRRDAAGAVWRQLAAVARPAGIDAWRWLDIEAGVPLVTEATKEEFVPQMANFELIGGVSFHKGCYPGQEVVARTQYLGKVKRHLYRLRAASPLAAGMPLHSPANPDQPCGQIVIGARGPGGDFEALAVLQENALAGEIRLQTPDGPAILAAVPVAAATSQVTQ